MTVNLPENSAQINNEQPKVVEDVKLDGNDKPKTAETTETASEDPNWRAFREARKQDREQRQAAEQRATEKEAEANALKAAMEAAFSKMTPPAQQQNYSDHYPHEESEDERIEKKVQQAIAARLQAEEKLRLQREQEEYPNRLTQTFPDFHQTISQEHLDYLDYHYPEVSRPFQRLPDNFDKWADIYRAVKKFVPNSANAKKDAAKADSNFNKPRSMSSSSITQPGESKSSNVITEERRAANWERMQRILKGVN
jgi:hypothetical protein